MKSVWQAFNKREVFIYRMLHWNFSGYFACKIILWVQEAVEPVYRNICSGLLVQNHYVWLVKHLSSKSLDTLQSMLEEYHLMFVLCLLSSLRVRRWDSHNFGSCWGYIFMRKKTHYIPELLEAMPTTNTNSWPCSATGQWQVIRIPSAFCLAHQRASGRQTQEHGDSLYHVAFPEIERYCLDYLCIGRIKESKGRTNKVMFKIARVKKKYFEQHSSLNSLYYWKSFGSPWIFSSFSG